MAPRYIRPEVNYEEEIPNNPFQESSVPISDAGILTSFGMLEMGDLTVVQGKIRVPGQNANDGNFDYGTF